MPAAPFHDAEKGPAQTLLPAPYAAGYHACPGPNGPLPSADVIALDPASLRRTRARRHWRVATVLLTIWLFWNWPLVMLGARRLASALHLGHDQHFNEGRMFDPAHYDEKHCTSEANWAERGSRFGKHHAYAALELPVDVDLLYVVARGGLASGSLTITDDGEGKDVATVEIDATYRADDALERARVCVLRPEDSQAGIGIFTEGQSWPHHPGHNEHHISFDVRVRLPASHGAQREFGKFETNLPLFSHHVPDISRSARFAEVAFHSSNMPIWVEALQTVRGAVKTSNGRISGSWNVSDSLELTTSNSPIDVEVHALNDPAAEDAPTRLALKTSNGHIDANLFLVSTGRHSTGGAFGVRAHTSNSPLGLVVRSAPVDSVLRLQGETSNAPGRVSLHPTYEGTFVVRSSSYFTPKVEVDGHVEDPAGKRRTRKAAMSRSRGEVRGEVSWGEKGEGEVELRTSNAPLELRL